MFFYARFVIILKSSTSDNTSPAAKKITGGIASFGNPTYTVCSTKILTAQNPDMKTTNDLPILVPRISFVLTVNAQLKKSHIISMQ